MVVRVKLRIVNEKNSASKELVVLVNGCAQSEKLVVVITPSDAMDIELETSDLELIEVEPVSGKPIA